MSCIATVDGFNLKKGEAARLTLTLSGSKSASYRIQVFNLTDPEACLTGDLVEGVNEIELETSDFRGTGHHVSIEVADGLGTYRFGFDISVGSMVFRYGFLCDFEDDQDNGDIVWLDRMHINHVQFYDWSYRHDCLIPPSETFQDMMGKRISLATVRHKIEACHNLGMKALAYAPVYAASKPFFEEHRDWGLFDMEGRPLVFIGVFHYMDISDGRGWRDHILKEYGKALGLVGFDGIHMDTYGFPKTAMDSDGHAVALDGQFGPFIDQAKDRLPGSCLVFNNVGAWPMLRTMGHKVDAVYCELWPPMDRYCHVQQTIREALRSGKPVVIAAYPHFMKTSDPEKALTGALCLDFMINCNGATHLWLGEDRAVVTQGYYSDYYRLSPDQAKAIEGYQDFFTRYQDLLYDRTLEDVSLTHFGGDNVEYQCLHGNCSVSFEPGRLALVFRENPHLKLICLLNLETAKDDLWNGSKDRPSPIDNVEFKVLVTSRPKSIWFSSPDGQSDPTMLDYSLETSEKGTFVRFRTPKIHLSAIVCLTF